MLKIYMAVTSDKYELPLHIVDSAKELAEKYDITVSSVYNSIANDKAIKSINKKFVKVEVEDD